MNSKRLMRNSAEKDVVRWCHLTHQFIAVNPKKSCDGVSAFFPKRFINCSIIIKR